MAYSKEFQVAIVGGGMCGLACAVYLSRAGVKVDLFESASKFGEVGAGVGLGPNALRALDDLGLTEAMLAHADQEVPDQRPFRFVSGLPGHEHIHDYEALPEDLGLGIHRAAFLDALVDLVDPAITHFNKRCTSVSLNGSRPVVHFRDGTTFEADIVLGADGIRSTVRQAVTGDPVGTKRVVFTRTVAYRALLPYEDIKRAGVTWDLTDRPFCVVGVDKHIITFPIKNGKIINVVVFCTNRSIREGSVEIPLNQWVTPAAEQEILDAYADCGPEVQRLLSLIENPSKWSIHSVDPPLTTFVKGSIALVGDAAHGMCPHLGAGVGQGFEDSLVICKLLTHPETDMSNVLDVLRAYDQVRRQRANLVLKRSGEAGDRYESLHEGDNTVTIENLRSELSDQWAFVHHHDLRADIGTAVEILRRDGGFK
ncbi:hypothetical protein HYDPIDRAFT_152978 [Hydnomerulius pinastri MD-312]|uniref:FAD-binding domain-containing protein n=1 Tax=Hydnomerulius pinastri MD-312 TaxID=994086 RepID=A0A0C9WGA1_9AGAM|nr:hypothetical protein HYDPIDRAFT_152978 [Hydnomerulius pinastri MD-312]